MNNYFYIIYKLLNNVLFKYYKKNKIKPNSICIDLNHATTHLGDRLFLLDLIYSLINSDIKLYCMTDDKVSLELFKALGIDIPMSNSPADLRISLKPMYLNRFMKTLKQNYSFIDYSNIKCPLSIGVAKEYCKHIGIEPSIFHPRGNQQSNQNIILFSNYIDSGWFRKFFAQEQRLYQKCKYLKQFGYKIIHIGTADDKKNDPRVYSFVDEDWRGQTSISEIVEQFNSGVVASVVTYDNMLLHLSQLFQIKAYVLFRGRFTKRACEHHMHAVNVALIRTVSKIEYLL